MNESFEEQIRTLLEEYSEQPPQSGWESLSQRLDAMHQGAAQVSGASSSATHAAPKSIGAKLKLMLGRTVVKAGLGVAAAGGLGFGGYLLLRQPAAEIRPEAPLAAALSDTGSATASLPDEPAAALPATPSEERADNTTFREGVPYHLLAEQPESGAAAAAGVTAQQAAERPSPPAQQPQQAEGNDRPEAPVSKTAAANTPKQAAAEKEEQPATEESRPKQPDLRIPNVISPNGDNINDYFVIENIGETTHNQLTIYTRNGKVVYDRKDYDNSWNAENLPAGTYLYWFSFEYAGHEFMRQGSVKVIR